MLNEVETGMEPGDAILRQLKAKFPPKKSLKKKETGKSKKLKKKVKKKRATLPQEDLGGESSGSSTPSTVPSSRDSGHASDSNSASRDSEDTNGFVKEIQAPNSPKKLSSRVAFFENAIIQANGKPKKETAADTPKRRVKEAAFLSKGEEKQSSPPALQNRRDSAEYSDSLNSVSSDDINDPQDPALEEPKYGTLFLSERDLKMEKKLMKQVAGEIEENGVSGVKKILLKKMNKWKSEKIRIGIMGDSLSGKSCMVKALGGLLASPSRYTGRPASCNKPTECVSGLNDSLSLWELPPISLSGKYCKANYLESIEAQNYDLFLICTPTWFKAPQIFVAEQIERKTRAKVVFVRTKLDDSIISDRKSRPKNHDELAVTFKVRNHCEEPLQKSALGRFELFLVSAFHLNRYDGPKLLSILLSNLQPKDKRKFCIQDAMALSLPALSLELIGRKRELLLERVWKVAAVSTVSGIMPIAGYNLTADIELLQSEIKFYRHQLGVTDDVLRQSSNCPKMVEVWNLLTEGPGVQSLLRQSAMDQEWTEFSKFMNRLPLIGGNVSFAATCSVLKYCLSELCSITIRNNELEIRRML